MLESRLRLKLREYLVYNRSALETFSSSMTYDICIGEPNYDYQQCIMAFKVKRSYLKSYPDFCNMNLDICRRYIQGLTAISEGFTMYLNQLKYEGYVEDIAGLSLACRDVSIANTLFTINIFSDNLIYIYL